jgi:hypothetical protein
VLSALVVVLTIVSAIAFAVVVAHTETVVTSKSRQQLADLVSRLAHDYAVHAQAGDIHGAARLLEAPDEAGADETLAGMTAAGLARDPGVEGGFYARASDALIGYAFPTHAGPAAKRDIPPIERPLIEDVATWRS